MLHDCMGEIQFNSLATTTHEEQLEQMHKMGLVSCTPRINMGTDYYTTTPLGDAHIKQLSNTPLPRMAYINTLTGEEIK